MKAVVMILAAVLGMSAVGVEYELNGNSRSIPDDPPCVLRPGLRMSCRVKFAADGSPVTGTCRIDYIWAGRLPAVDLTLFDMKTGREVDMGGDFPVR